MDGYTTGSYGDTSSDSYDSGYSGGSGGYTPSPYYNPGSTPSWFPGAPQNQNMTPAPSSWWGSGSWQPGQGDGGMESAYSPEYSTGGWADPSSAQFDQSYKGGDGNSWFGDQGEFGNRFKKFLTGVLGNKVAQHIPGGGLLAGPLMGAATAPEGRRMEGFGRGIAGTALNGLMGAIPGLGVVNSLSGLFGGPTVGSWFNNLTKQQAPEGSNPNVGYGGSAAQNLLGAWAANQQGNKIGGLANDLRSMYGPDSPYSKQLQQTLDRKDAAAGRRSQYGARNVELQARLADMNSRNAPNLAEMYKQQGNSQRSMINNLYEAGSRSGLFNAIGKGLGSMYDASQGFTGNNDFSNPEDFWKYGSSGD